MWVAALGRVVAGGFELHGAQHAPVGEGEMVAHRASTTLGACWSTSCRLAWPHRHPAVRCHGAVNRAVLESPELVAAYLG